MQGLVRCRRIAVLVLKLVCVAVTIFLVPDVWQQVKQYYQIQHNKTLTTTEKTQNKGIPILAYNLWQVMTRQDEKYRIPLQTTIRNSQYKGIPKIIHQTWNTELIPEVFHDNIRGLVGHNQPPEWTYYFWTEQSGSDLINKTFPRLLKRYTQAAGVLKADIRRLVVLYQYGGVYFDLDTVSVKPLNPYVETRDCSLVTDPPEHTLNQKPNNPEPVLLITNSAMLCKPFNWFILHVIKQLETQSATCRQAVTCTGPWFITKLYEEIQKTNRSADLPVIDDYRYFEDMVDRGTYRGLNQRCQEPFTTLKHEWNREICRNWIKRGRDKRNISEKAFTYHTWYHTYFNEKQLKANANKDKKISELVPNVTFYTD